ncbi:MAG: DoxX family protein [Chlamydiales bacterium]|nr:DoxX family protein [Chlamydiia bacterium]MCP5506914.1 DoxX family protein [Chlamydiales bacterium]
MSGFKSFVMLLGRVLLSAFFIWGGVSKVLHFDESVQFMQSHGLASANALVVGACVIELVGGFSLLLGIWARWGALMLVLYMIAYTYLFNDFWAQEGAEMHLEKVSFIMNLGLIGGLLYVFSCGAGHCSFDSKGCSDSSCCK